MSALKERFREFRRTKSGNCLALPSGHKVEYFFKASRIISDKYGPRKKKIKLDERPAGEDEVSFARHNRRIKAESIKPHPNRGIVKELMKVIYAIRREDINDNCKTVVEILNDYPFLNN